MYREFVVIGLLILEILRNSWRVSRRTRNLLSSSLVSCAFMDLLSWWICSTNDLSKTWSLRYSWYRTASWIRWHLILQCPRWKSRQLTNSRIWVYVHIDHVFSLQLNLHVNRNIVFWADWISDLLNMSFINPLFQKNDWSIVTIYPYLLLIHTFVFYFTCVFFFFNSMNILS